MNSTSEPADGTTAPTMASSTMAASTMAASTMANSEQTTDDLLAMLLTALPGLDPVDAVGHADEIADLLGSALEEERA